MKNAFLENNKNKKILSDGISLLSCIEDESISCAVFDPQYRQIMDKMKYGNEGERQVSRALLPQMQGDVISTFINEISRVLKPSSYLFFWVDKFILAEGIHLSLLGEKQRLSLVDLIVWDKGRIGMGYRSRRRSEFIVVYQKEPKTTKNWKDKGVPDVWCEKILNPRSAETHPHKKPHELLERLVLSVANPGEYILDPCAGSFSLLEICQNNNLNFIGCDISSDYANELIRKE